MRIISGNFRKIGPKFFKLLHFEKCETDDFLGSIIREGESSHGENCVRIFDQPILLCYCACHKIKSP